MYAQLLGGDRTVGRGAGFQTVEKKGILVAKHTLD
jgi:hypothetical protein